jgi:hypothetical protein
MADRLTIYAPSGRRLRVTRRQYEKVYKPSGWRTTKSSGSTPVESTQKGDEPESKE